MAYSILRQINQGDKKLWLTTLSAHVLGAISLGLVYHYQYGAGDTLFYFDQAVDLLQKEGLLGAYSAQLSLLKAQPRSIFFIKLILPIVFISGYNYWMSAIWMATLLFIPHWVLYKTLAAQYPNLKPILACSILFLPSYLFFSTGLSKDAIASAVLAFLISTVVKWHFKERISPLELILTIFCGFVLVKIKHYAAAVFLLSVLLVLIGKVKFKKAHWNYLLYFGLIALAANYIKFFHPWLRLERLPLTIYETNQAIVEMSKAGGIISFDLSPTYGSLILNTPKALFTGLFRPFPWESMNWLSLIIKIENLTLLFMSIFSIWHWRKWKINYLIVSTIIFISALSVFLSLATPNFGTLVRYKTLYLPYFFLLISIIPYQILLSDKLR